MVLLGRGSAEDDILGDNNGVCNMLLCFNAVVVERFWSSADGYASHGDLWEGTFLTHKLIPPLLLCRDHCPGSAEIHLVWGIAQAFLLWVLLLQVDVSQIKQQFGDSCTKQQVYHQQQQSADGQAGLKFTLEGSLPGFSSKGTLKLVYIVVLITNPFH